MFGSSDNQQTTTMGPPAVQDPAMLDGVQPPAQTRPSVSAVASNTSTTVAQPMPASTESTEHVMTTDNPFIQNPIGDTTPTPAISQPEPTPPVSSPLTPAFPTEPPATTSPVTDTPVLENETVEDAEAEESSSAPAPALAPLEPVNTDQLASMKQEALGHLEPLVGHLDQGPEEEFKTVMMMIQANDNHTLLEKALEAAKKIEDDKARAQAMLDIINEINYFSTQY